MSKTDAAIVARWKARLKIRQALRDHAERQAAYWRSRWNTAHNTDDRLRAFHMLNDRKAKLEVRRAQVHEAEAVIARHSVPSLRERAFKVAEDNLGIMESGGNNRGPEVEKVIKANGGVPGESWCGDFVAYCYLRAGCKTVVRNWAAVRFLEQLLTEVKNPAKGHVVIYQWDSGDPDHTGLFKKWIDKKAGDFQAIEGNAGSSGATSDSKSGDGVRLRNRNVRQVSSFRRVLR